MRCPEPVILAVNAILAAVQKMGCLNGRIKKPFRHYPPTKGPDSKKYPHIQVAECSAQALKTNYFGKYIAHEVRKIPAAEIEESHEKSFPTVLVIGSIQYLRQIRTHLEAQGFAVERKPDSKSELTREAGLQKLKTNPDSNLGWRIILETDRPPFEKKAVSDSVKTSAPIHTLLPKEFRAAILKEAESFQATTEVISVEAPEVDKSKPLIKLTSFQGSKGLSAQHVFVVGLHENELPLKASDIKDLEICKFLVSLTRTRKQCHLLTTYRFSGAPKHPSIFLAWIPSALKKVQKINKAFWENLSDAQHE